MSIDSAVCAIHQPNFFPWMGYFDKLRRSDVFVFLDEVMYPKSGSGMGSWVNRVKINIQGHAAWVGCPVQRQSGNARIRDVRIDDSKPWRRTLLRTLEMNYRRAPYYESTMNFLAPLIAYHTDVLSEFNINAISNIARRIGINVRLVRQSELAASGAGTSLLVNIARAVRATTYLCGGGAAGYQDDAAFPQAGLHLQYQSFEPTPYGDPSRYIPGLSIVDFLFWNCG